MALNYLFTSFCIYDNYKNVLHAFGAAARTRTTLISSANKYSVRVIILGITVKRTDSASVLMRHIYIYIHTHTHTYTHTIIQLL